MVAIHHGGPHGRFCRQLPLRNAAEHPAPAPGTDRREGQYHWHKHDDDDEFFYVVEGKLHIDLEGRTVELGPRQGFVVPKTVVHRTRAPHRTVILMVENAGIIPTGN
jgi:hypothetical protein